MITNDEIIQQEQRIINKWVSLKSSAFTRNKEFNLTLISIKNSLSIQDIEKILKKMKSLDNLK